MSWEFAPGLGVVRDAAEETPGYTYFIAPLPRGPVQVMSGVAAAILEGAVTQGDLAGACDVVARELALPAEDIEQDAVAEFIDELLELGLLVQV